MEGIAHRCVAVMKGVFEGERLAGVDTNDFFLVDPQGHSYARYMASSYQVVRDKQRRGEDYQLFLSNVRKEMAKLKRPAATGRLQIRND